MKTGRITGLLSAAVLGASILAAGCSRKAVKEYSFFDYESGRLVKLTEPQAKEMLPGLITSLSDSDEDIRLRSTQRLGDFGSLSSNAIESLINILNNDESVTVRRGAAFALTRIDREGNKVFLPLIEATKGGDIDMVETISNLSLDPKRLPDLINLLNDENPYVRMSIVGLLPKIDSAIPILIKVLHSDENTDVKRQASKALKLLDRDERAGLALIEATRGGDYQIMKIVGDSYANSKLLPDLINLLNDENKYVRISAARLFVRIKDELGPACPVLREALRDNDSLVKKIAIEILASHIKENEEILPELITTLRGDSKLVTGAVAYYLGNLGSKAIDAEEPLAKALSDGNGTLKREVIDALSKIGVKRKETIAALVNILKDEDEDVRNIAYKLLRKRAPEVTQSLIGVFQENKGKRDLFMLIKGIGPKALPELLNALEGEKKSVNKANIILLLGILSRETNDEVMQSNVFKVLIQALEDKNESVRYNAVTSLELFKSKAKDAVKLLQEIEKNDEDEQVRQKASDALIEIKN